MYSGFQICGALKPKVKCIRLRKYNAGQGNPYTELFHEHVPEHRISEDNAVEMMKAMVLRYQKAPASYIMCCYLNNRGKEPASCNPFQIVVDYPEPGVVRKYCGTDFQAWVDTVIAPRQFRRERG
jgi:hypothetical protein